MSNTVTVHVIVAQVRVGTSQWPLTLTYTCATIMANYTPPTLFQTIARGLHDVSPQLQQQAMATLPEAVLVDIIQQLEPSALAWMVETRESYTRMVHLYRSSADIFRIKIATLLLIDVRHLLPESFPSSKQDETNLSVMKNLMSIHCHDVEPSSALLCYILEKMAQATSTEQARAWLQWLRALHETEVKMHLIPLLRFVLWNTCLSGEVLQIILYMKFVDSHNPAQPCDIRQFCINTLHRMPDNPSTDTAFRAVLQQLMTGNVHVNISGLLQHTVRHGRTQRCTILIDVCGWEVVRAQHLFLAVEHGLLDMVDLLLQHMDIFNAHFFAQEGSRLMELAMTRKTDYLVVAQRLMGKGCQMTESCLVTAMQHSHVDFVRRHVNEQGRPLSSYGLKQMMRAAVELGHRGALIWLLERMGGRYQWENDCSDEMFEHAAECNTLMSVLWVSWISNDCLRSCLDTCMNKSSSLASCFTEQLNKVVELALNRGIVHPLPFLKEVIRRQDSNAVLRHLDLRRFSIPDLQLALEYAQRKDTVRGRANECIIQSAIRSRIATFRY